MIRKHYQIPLLNGQNLNLGPRTLIMGILNITPDSFSDGGKYLSPDSAIQRALDLVQMGADIIDIGGESTRPGSNPVSAEDEIARVLPVIEALKDQISIPISIDTYKASVAKAALKAGAVMVNDISGLQFDNDMAKVVADNDAVLCLMHTRGRPQVMHKLPASANIWQELLNDLENSINVAVKAGIKRENLIVDPGIGFGKTLEDNLCILAQLDRLQRFNLPILIGTSRKSFIAKLTNNSQSNRIMGTAASITVAILHGAHIARVHDVAAMVETVCIADALNQYCKD